MLKAFFKKAFKFFFCFLMALLLIITLLVMWPLKEIEPPESSEFFQIVNINVVDVLNGDVLSNRTVLIERGKIKAIKRYSEVDLNLPNSINASGKYLVPGLWDMHGHSTQLSPWMHHPLMVANGVTGVRELSGNLGKKDNYWAGASERLVWNEEVRNRQRVAPRFIQQSSFQLDGAASVPGSFPKYFRLDDPRDVAPMLSDFKRQGVDLIKVYYQIPAESYRKLAAEAPNYGMYLAGHKPVYIDLQEAIDLGQKSFEHGRLFFWACDKVYSGLHSENWKQAYLSSKEIFITKCNEDKVRDLMMSMAEQQTYWVPTLLTLKVSAFADDQDFLNNQNLGQIMYLRRKLLWDFDIGNAARANREQDEVPDNLKLYRKAQAYVNKAHELGVPIMAGTDVTDSNNFAGASLHYELVDLVESGLSPLDAIKSATIIPAVYAGLESTYGSVETDKSADLLILDANPLVDISNTQKIHGVILNGVYYDRTQLESLQAEVEQYANSVHMNVKFLYSLFSSRLMLRQILE